jgi:type IV pilus assembly protein PilF
MKRFAIALLVVTAAGCSTQPGNFDTPQKATASANAHTELAVAYYEQGQYKTALEEVSKALHANSQYAPAYNVRGLLHMTLQEDTEAEDDFRHSLSLADDPDTHVNYGWFLCQRGRAREAIDQFMVAAKDPLNQNQEKAYLDAGVCSKKAGNKQDAEKYFQRALILHPNLPGALVGMAELAFINGDYAGAKSYFMRYERATLLPLAAEDLLLAVRIERKLGNRSAEANYAMRLNKNYPDSREAQLMKQLK